MKKMMEKDGRFEFIRSATTRAPRGDGHDNEYIYVSREEFLSRIENGKMLEYMEYGENFYGTPASEIERIFDLGKTPLLILDIVGVNSIKSTERDFRTIAMYIYDDLDVMEERLYSRELAHNPTEQALATFIKRKNANICDYDNIPSYAHLFDAFIKNDTVDSSADRALCELDRLISGGERSNYEISTIVNSLKASAQAKK